MAKHIKAELVHKGQVGYIKRPSHLVFVRRTDEFWEVGVYNLSLHKMVSVYTKDEPSVKKHDDVYLRQRPLWLWLLIGRRWHIV